MDIDPYRLVGTEIGYADYRLMKFVGAGGMGVVYQALDRRKGKTAAVKLLKPDILAKFPEYTHLFSSEVKAIRLLDHPNIVKVYDSGALVQGIPFMVMEWLGGRTLDQILTSPLPLPKMILFFEQICSAIEYAHKRKIIHLDLKPENIFLVPGRGTDEAVVKIIDFGLSRILSTYSGTTVTRFGGSLHYCSPEHFGGRVSTRSDIFSLGVVLYHMLTGVIPVGGSYIVAKQSGKPLPPLPSLTRQNPDIPKALEQVIEKALQSEPDKRYQSVNEMMGDIRSAFSSFGYKSADQQAEVNNANNERPEHVKLDQAVFKTLMAEFPNQKEALHQYYSRRRINLEVAQPSKGVDTDTLIKRSYSPKDDPRILVIIFLDPIEAYLYSKVIEESVSTNSSYQLIIGWYYAENEYFYLLSYNFSA